MAKTHHAHTKNKAGKSLHFVQAALETLNLGQGFDRWPCNAQSYERNLSIEPWPIGTAGLWNFRVKRDQRNGRQHAHINYLSPQLPRSCRSAGTPAQAFSWHPLMTRKRKQGKVTSTGKWEKHNWVQNVIRVCEIYELARVRNQP